MGYLGRKRSAQLLDVIGNSVPNTEDKSILGHATTVVREPTY